jgi:hypothetical protein
MKFERVRLRELVNKVAVLPNVGLWTVGWEPGPGRKRNSGHLYVSIYICVSNSSPELRSFGKEFADGGAVLVDGPMKEPLMVVRIAQQITG